jgi:hypothetical protein
MKKQYVYKKKLGGLIGTGVGAIAGSFVGNPALGASLGGMAGSAIESATEKSPIEQGRIMNSSYGYRKGGKLPKYPMGGKMPLPQGAGKYVGASHEQGGIPVDEQGNPTSEQQAIAEVEGGETEQDGYIFSDTLMVPETDMTFAQAHEMLLQEGADPQEIEQLAQMQEQVKAESGEMEQPQEQMMQEEMMQPGMEEMPMMAGGGSLRRTDRLRQTIQQDRNISTRNIQPQTTANITNPTTIPNLQQNSSLQQVANNSWDRSSMYRSTGNQPPTTNTPQWRVSSLTNSTTPVTNTPQSSAAQTVTRPQRNAVQRGARNMRNIFSPLRGGTSSRVGNFMKGAGAVGGALTVAAVLTDGLEYLLSDKTPEQENIIQKAVKENPELLEKLESGDESVLDDLESVANNSNELPEVTITPEPSNKEETSSEQELSFGQAFSQARKEGKSEFTWKGKKYHTRTKEEEETLNRAESRVNRQQEIQSPTSIDNRTRQTTQQFAPNTPVAPSVEKYEEKKYGGKLVKYEVGGDLEQAITKPKTGNFGQNLAAYGVPAMNVGLGIAALASKTKKPTMQNTAITRANTSPFTQAKSNIEGSARTSTKAGANPLAVHSNTIKGFSDIASAKNTEQSRVNERNQAIATDTQRYNQGLSRQYEDDKARKIGAGINMIGTGLNQASTTYRADKAMENANEMQRENNLINAAISSFQIPNSADQKRALSFITNLVKNGLTIEEAIEEFKEKHPELLEDSEQPIHNRYTSFKGPQRMRYGGSLNSAKLKKKRLGGELETDPPLNNEVKNSNLAEKRVSENYVNNFPGIKRHLNIQSSIVDTYNNSNKNPERFSMPDSRTSLHGMSQADSVFYNPLINRVDRFLSERDSVSSTERDNTNTLLYAAASYDKNMPSDKTDMDRFIQEKISDISDSDLQKILSNDFTGFRDGNMIQRIARALRVKPENVSVRDLMRISNYLNSEEGKQRYQNLHTINSSIKI